MMKISREDWRDTYLPEYDEDQLGFLKMYSADDLITVKKDTDPHHIWTELSDMMGTVLPGVRFVDRLCYYISEKPWRDEDYHSLEVTDLITKADYLAEIEYFRDDGDAETAELLQEMMNEEFPDGD